MHILGISIFTIQIISLVIAAPPPPLSVVTPFPGLSLLSTSPFNASSSSNLTGSGTKPNLPSEPYFYPIPHSDEQLKIWSFGARIRNNSALLAFRDIRRDIAVNLRARTEMNDSTLHYQSGKLHFIFHCSVGMTWEVFSTIVDGLQSWFDEWEWVECDFDMGQIGMDDMFGIGAVVQFDLGLGEE